MAIRIHRQRQLKTLAGQLTRPTTSRVRSALFSIWQLEIAGCRWLDLCSGCGTVAAEALSRGCASVVGVESSAAACRVIRHNWQQVAQSHQHWQLWPGDVRRVLPKLQGQQFDRIYADPPYHSDLYEALLAGVDRWQLLDPAGEFALEHDRHRDLPQRVGCLACYRQKSYGRTTLSFFVVNPSP